MTLLETLKAANINALKAKDKDARAVLSVVINRVTTKEKEHNTVLTDEEVLGILLKVNKELEEEKLGYQRMNNTERVESIEKQLLVIEKFVPKQLSDEEILHEIAKLSDKSLPNVMKHFKINFAGRVDLGRVSKLAKQ
jgi:uncharacterized protein YqeY